MVRTSPAPADKPAAEKSFLTIKHKGAGRYIVLDAGGAVVCDEYMDRDAAEAYVAAHGA